MDKASEGRRSSCCGCTESVDWKGWGTRLDGEGNRGMAGRSRRREWN